MQHCTAHNPPSAEPYLCHASPVLFACTAVQRLTHTAPRQAAYMCTSGLYSCGAVCRLLTSFLCVLLLSSCMLQHLWTGPISNAPVEIIQGGRSVEVRPVGVTKGLAMQRILGYMGHIMGRQVGTAAGGGGAWETAAAGGGGAWETAAAGGGAGGGGARRGGERRQGQQEAPGLGGSMYMYREGREVWEARGVRKVRAAKQETGRGGPWLWCRR